MMESLVTVVLWGWLFLAATFALLWLVEWRTGDASAVDVGWAAGLGFLALYYAALSDGPLFRRVALAALAGGWGLRLALYLLRNRVLGSEKEDGRYRRLRARWGERAHPFFFLFYQAQALLAVILSAPFLIIAGNRAPAPHPLELVAVLVWLVALAGESIADRQLARFRARPSHRGQTCREGLWRFSRHPNYFFEWLIWCAYAMAALPAPYGAWGLVSPALMLFLILKVTGIPPTEEQALESRGEDYRRYQRTTSAFFPWPPRETAEP